MASDANHNKAPGSVLIVGVGASRGVGAAIARRFSREGHPVAIAGRSFDKLKATASEIEATGGRITVAIGDAATAADAQRFVAAAQALGLWVF